MGHSIVFNYGGFTKIAFLDSDAVPQFFSHKKWLERKSEDDFVWPCTSIHNLLIILLSKTTLPPCPKMILLLCCLKKLLLLLEIRYLYLELKFRATGNGIQQFQQIYLGHLSFERFSCSIEQKNWQMSLDKFRLRNELSIILLHYTFWH